MKPRSRLRHRAAFGPAVLAAAAVLALVSAAPDPASGRSSGGWKPVPAQGDVPQGGHGSQRRDAGRGSAENDSAESGPRTPSLAESSGFYSNLGLLDAISREAVNAIADSLALPPGSAVALYASNPNEANWFVGNILGETLAKRGYKVRILDWGAAVAAGDSSKPTPPAASAPAHPNHPRPGDQQGTQGENKPPQGPDAKNGGDKNEDGAKDGATRADTTAANPDSAQANADSVRSGSEGVSANKKSPGKKPQAGEQAAPTQGQPVGSAATPAATQGPAAALRVFPPGVVLDLRLVEFGVSYADVGRKLLFGPLRFTRVAGVYLQVSSRTEPEGELRQVLTAERHRVDRISGSQRSLAEGASYPFKIPELKVPGLGRYIEPTVVVGIVGSLVYLFNANQSSK